MFANRPHLRLLYAVALVACAGRVALAQMGIDEQSVIPVNVAPPGVPTALVTDSQASLPPLLREWEIKPQTTIRLRGRIDTDFIWTSQSAANTATFGDLGDAAGLRRARIGVQGNLLSGHYIGEIDLASGQVVIRDLFIGLGDVDRSGEDRIAHFREPFSLEGGTSANTFAFME